MGSTPPDACCSPKAWGAKPMNAIKRATSFVKSVLAEPITLGDVLRAAIALLVVAAVSGFLSGRAHAQVYLWSKTPGTNASVDPHINFSIGMAPSAVGASSRSEMAELAKYRDDTSGAIVATGTASAFVVTSNQGFSSFAAMRHYGIPSHTPAT